MCHIPFDPPVLNEHTSGDTEVSNGQMIYFATTYSIPGGLPVPVTYQIFDFRSGAAANAILQQGDSIPPSICTS
eukprot:CAMPEP_0206206572 /NCGR_PEP_ID=MMETSP0166-20121206/15043_1 /ASSEMBLY_ACC=CAM_ASM_000260 /TAXON_ID=95228 /ORGANISM="Vannella robusta, Strain DIVA3 518/3/11/1/6" /LENGTH=73 /DNA_ID=CAMNT_0053627103 /DNA_START=112 /DNA_END=333 /DNA_ORIENTATION=-